MERLQREGITLNPDKINYKETEVKYLGHVLTTNGSKTDEDKIEAIISLEKPRNVT